jgi:tetratricopeptide (TPR) repeat protein
VSPDEGIPEPTSAKEAPPPSPAERRFRESLGLAREGDLPGAMAGYRQVLELDPGHLRARNNLAVLLDRTGDHGSAAEHLRAALELEPENPELLSNLGAALGALGRFEEAEEALKRALRLDPSGHRRTGEPGDPPLPEGALRPGRDGAPVGLRTGREPCFGPLLSGRGPEPPRAGGGGPPGPAARRGAPAREPPGLPPHGNPLRPEGRAGDGGRHVPEGPDPLRAMSVPAGPGAMG